MRQFSAGNQWLSPGEKMAIGGRNATLAVMAGIAIRRTASLPLA